ncbi:Oidioi.mRNA.OKI2018_I69.chr1.g577.t1.cds [Oikopleura dioica]|uniref:Oidioi.mRNA.OKI2018_I69.chr1.g577.t1.cds n=1 Tax=Oikopleura dioica TaxID=34765 RepID=A0ABN7SSH1_OIKDI|nr:Oidioi.mRNA.OKI2018_I69.chr1.g577.t1.cds [Oikopleura dioica]
MKIATILLTSEIFASRHHKRSRRSAIRHRRRRELHAIQEAQIYRFKINDDLAEEAGITNIRTISDLGDEDFRLLESISTDAGERYIHLKRMVGFIFNDLEEGIEKPHVLDWWGYGCWCLAHGENYDLAMRGMPMDEVDSVCKMHAQCVQCAQMDYGASCDASHGYGIFGQKDLINGDRTLVCDAENDLCGSALCECDKMLIEGLRATFTQYDSSLHIENSGFDSKGNCPAIGGPPADQCCGEYPYRQPYNSRNGQRSCCLDKTYDTSYLECCQDEIKPNGFCQAEYGNSTSSTW